MNPNTTTASPGYVKTGASAAIATAIVGIISGVLTMTHHKLPEAMAGDLFMLLAPLVHFIGQAIGNRSKPVPAAPVAPTAIPVTLATESPKP